MKQGHPFGAIASLFALAAIVGEAHAAAQCLFELSPAQPPYDVLGSHVVPQSNIVTFADCHKTLDEVRADLAMLAERRAEMAGTKKKHAHVVRPPVPVAQEAPALSFGGFGSVGFGNCSAARAAGFGRILLGTPGYARHLDRDNDGIACEW
jgi:hypothetical protein